MMKRITVITEMAKDGNFSCYMADSDDLDYAVIGVGATAAEARDDFMDCYHDMKNLYANQKRAFEEVDFDFIFDFCSILSFYENQLSLEGLHRITGVPVERLRGYVNGGKKPRPHTVDRIFASLRAFGQTMSSTAIL